MRQWLGRHWASTLCVGAILYLSLVKEPLPHVMEGLLGFDKVGHFVMYMVLGVLLAIEYPRKHRRGAFIGWAIVFPIALGGIIELLQAYCTVNRSGDWVDFIADMLGVLCGVGVAPLVRRCPLIRNLY